MFFFALMTCVAEMCGQEGSWVYPLPNKYKKMFLNSYFVLDDWTEEVCMTSKCDHSAEQILCNRTKKNTSCMVVVFCYTGIWNVSWYASSFKEHGVICDFELLWYVKNVVFEIDISCQNPIYCQCPSSFLFLVTKLKLLVDKSDSVWGFSSVTTQLNIFAFVERHMQFAIICHFSCSSV